MTLDIPITFHPCLPEKPSHVIEHGSKHCKWCGKSHGELGCPTEQDCRKVYSSNVEIIDGVVHRRWICRVCLHEGAERMPDAQEYTLLMGKLAEFKSGPSGGPVMDGPLPDLRVEFAKSFRGDN